MAADTIELAHWAYGEVLPPRVAAITGHKTLKEVERYTRSAEQARLARQAIARQQNKP